jgi:hypothetical protein
MLVIEAREMEGREASPTAGVINSQSAKTIEAGAPRGCDAGKEINGRKRYRLVNTIGLLIAAIVHRARSRIATARPCWSLPWAACFARLRHIFADAACVGSKLRQALAKLGSWSLEIVRRSDAATGFQLLAAPTGHRTQDRSAQPQSPPRQGLRSNHRKRKRLALHRQRQAALAPDRQGVMHATEFWVRLSRQRPIRRAENEPHRSWQ